MLTRLEIEGLRSFERLSLDLTPLTVLIGPNGSGKSNALDVFSLLSAAGRGALADAWVERGGTEALAFRGTDGKTMRLGLFFSPEGVFEGKGRAIRYHVRLARLGNMFRVSEELASIERDQGVLEIVGAAQAGEYRFYNEATGQPGEVKRLDHDTELAIAQVKDKTAYPTAFDLAQMLASWRIYSLPSTSPDAPLRRAQLLRSGLRVARDGSNLFSVLHSIKENHHSHWEDMCDVIKTACPGFQHLSLPSEGGDGMIVLRWFEEPFATRHGLSANLLSDGTLRFLMLLAILLSPDPPPLVCIDEPEVGLHPDWITLVGELLQSAAERTQLIVSTHSPELVSAVKPSQVVVVEKEDGRTVANRLDDDELAHWLDRYRLGDLWRTGHIGGTGL